MDWSIPGFPVLQYMLSMFVIAFFPRSKHLLISWLQSSSPVILESKKNKICHCCHFFPSICYEVMILVFWMLSFKSLFHCPLSPSSRGSLVPLDFLPLEWYHLHIWGCWYFSQQSRFQLMIHPAWHFTYFKKARWQYTALMYSFPNFEPVCSSMSHSNSCFLTFLQVSQEAGKMIWYSHLFKNFPQLVVDLLKEGKWTRCLPSLFMCFFSCNAQGGLMELPSTLLFNPSALCTVPMQSCVDR